jgi:hypothetical protein
MKGDEEEESLLYPQPLGLEIEHRVTNESGGDWLKFGSVVMTEWRRDGG